MKSFWHGKNVLLTGHTGFKGSWLAEILLSFGANVTGCALAPDRSDDLFNLCKLNDQLDHYIVDIRNKSELLRIFLNKTPDVVFHLAAQPLVIRSYNEPVITWDTNVMGTINILECLRILDKRCAVVMVTTDKVYEISEKSLPRSENDHLGGHDPYSSSKAAMEIAVSSWRRSFFAQSEIKISTARAGNVIGGGDWSNNRIIPDLIKALHHDTDIELRNPGAVRPWQHVLEPLFGYLKLAKALYFDERDVYQAGFNFGPDPKLIATVGDLVSEACKVWGGKTRRTVRRIKEHEAPFLSLDSTKARDLLGWEPKWDFSQTVFHTVNWYKSYLQGNDATSLIKEQIYAYAESV